MLSGSTDTCSRLRFVTIFDRARLPSKDSEGHQVLVRDIVGFDGEGLLRYRLDDGREVSESILLPTVKDSGPVERLAKLQLAHPSGIRARVSGMHLDGWTPSQGHGAVLGARVQWLPHQIDVAARGLDAERTRLLLCDEVGLGKTVEAALIYAGLRAEQRAERVLILTPEALCIQWLGELYRKAHELVVLLDEERIEEAYDHFRDIGPLKPTVESLHQSLRSLQTPNSRLRRSRWIGIL